MKNYSVNDEYIRVSFFIKKDYKEILDLKVKKEKTTFKNLFENILSKNL